MNSLIQEVQSKLVVLAGQAVFVLPGIVFAIILLLLTRTAANLVRRAVLKLASSTLKSLSLQSLLVQTSYAATWVIGILISCIVAFPDLNLSDLIALLGLGSVANGKGFL